MRVTSHATPLYLAVLVIRHGIQNAVTEPKGASFSERGAPAPTCRGPTGIPRRCGRVRVRCSTIRSSATGPAGRSDDTEDRDDRDRRETPCDLEVSLLSPIRHGLPFLLMCAKRTMDIRAARRAGLLANSRRQAPDSWVVAGRSLQWPMEPDIEGFVAELINRPVRPRQPGRPVGSQRAAASHHALARCLSLLQITAVRPKEQVGSHYGA